MTSNEIMEIVTPIVASLGGAAGVVAIVTSIVKWVATYKSTKATQGTRAELRAIKDDIVAGLESRLNCALDIDITAKLGAIADEFFDGSSKVMRKIEAEISALKEMNEAVAKRLLNSTKVSADEREAFNANMEKCNEVIKAVEIESKPKIKIELKTTDAEKTKKRVIDGVTV